MEKIAVIVPNWNGLESIAGCVESLLKQSVKSTVIVVENGSKDDSLEFLRENYGKRIRLIVNQVNLGFAGGVNSGIKQAIIDRYEYVALFNNDAVADKDWLKNLVECLEKEPKVGIATCKFISEDKSHIDSTGDMYTNWGLPYPRGRDEAVSDKYDKLTDVFAASGGASLYRVSMLNEIGLFDEDFFAYYEDVDISFRAQLAGWKVKYVPSSIAYHQIGATSGKIKGFTTYQTLKNLPLLFWKNVPLRFMPTIMPRLALSDTAFYVNAVARGQFIPATKGVLQALILLPKKLVERQSIQRNRKVSDDYIWQMVTHDLPPNAHKLRFLRSKWRRLIGAKP